MAEESRQITAEETERRRKAVRNAMRSNAMEGLKPNPYGQPVFDAFVAGEFDLEELGPRLDEVLGQTREGPRMVIEEFPTPPWVENQKKMLDEMLENGIPLVQSRDDGTWIKRHPDGREEVLPYRNLSLGMPIMAEESFKITAEETERRRKAVRKIMRSNAMEGLAIDPLGQEVFDDFIAGEIGLADVMPRLKALAGQK